MSKIVYNAIRTPDGTVLESNWRYDYKTHKDKCNKKIYMVDGGIDYLRRSNHGDEVDLSVTLDAPYEVIRQYVKWGTRGINGDQPLTYVKLCDMETAHIQAVIIECKPHPSIFDAMIMELAYREHSLIMQGCVNVG